MSVAALRCSGLVHVHLISITDVAALRGIGLELPARRSLALLGPSGSGKSNRWASTPAAAVLAAGG